jgi:hypothetical protein
MDTFNRLAANALACGRTRVVLYELWTDQPEEGAAFLTGFERMGIHPQLFHGVTNASFDGATIARGRLAYARFMFGKFAALMKATADLGLLDDTIILWATNEPNGTHSVLGTAPCLYGGAGGGRFLTGKYLTTKTASINDVFTSVLRGVGAPTDRFGDDNSGRAQYGADDLMLA